MYKDKPRKPGGTKLSRNPGSIICDQETAWVPWEGLGALSKKEAAEMGSHMATGSLGLLSLSRMLRPPLSCAGSGIPTESPGQRQQPRQSGTRREGLVELIEIIVLQKIICKRWYSADTNWFRCSDSDGAPEIIAKAAPCPVGVADHSTWETRQWLPITLWLYRCFQEQGLQNLQRQGLWCSAHNSITQAVPGRTLCVVKPAPGRAEGTLTAPGVQWLPTPTTSPKLHTCCCPL